MKKLMSLSLIVCCMARCENDIGPSASMPGTGQGGSLARFAISDDYMYAVHGTSLKVFSLANAEKPSYITSTDLQVPVETVFLRDSATLFIGSTDGMFIYDISQAPEVRLISSYHHITSCDPVVANQQYAYVTLRSSDEDRFCNHDVNQLDVLDISRLHDPTLVHTVAMEYPMGLALYADTLLVCDNGIKIFEVNDTLQPRLMATHSHISAVDIIPYGNLMIVATRTGLAQYKYHKGSLTLLSEL